MQLFKERIGLFQMDVLLNPGEHIFGTTSENRSELKLTLEANKTYFIEQKAKFGVAAARTKLELFDPLKGQEMLYKCISASSKFHA